MSIATEISRLQTAKADIKTAIEAKGVTVPSSATLDSYNTYISQIQTGSGGGGTNYLEQYVNKTLSGTITSAQLGTNIGSKMTDYFLYGQDNITSVDLTGTGATSISSNFCQRCNKLSSVIIPDTVTQIWNYFCADSGISTFTIPSTVIKIGTYFLQGSKVQSITIPSTVTNLNSDCLNGCSSLVQLIYNAPIAVLPRALCTNTNNLAFVDLNSSVTKIDSYCFSSRSASTNLLEVVLRNTSSVVTLPNKIGNTSYSSAFRNRKNMKIYVPSALKASYEADSNWAEGVTAGYLTIETIEGSQYE